MSELEILKDLLIKLEGFNPEVHKEIRAHREVLYELVVKRLMTLLGKSESEESIEVRALEAELQYNIAKRLKEAEETIKKEEKS